MSSGRCRRSLGKLYHGHPRASPSDPPRRTITALAVAVSALGFSGMVSLGQYIFISKFVFTVKIVPQVWRLVTAFLITKPKFGIVLDPYFLYQYGSGLERESSRFSQPGDFVLSVASFVMYHHLVYLPAQPESMVEAVPETEEEHPCTLCSPVIRII
jgi:Derlin-2/3